MCHGGDRRGARRIWCELCQNDCRHRSRPLLHGPAASALLPRPVVARSVRRPEPLCILPRYSDSPGDGRCRHNRSRACCNGNRTSAPRVGITARTSCRSRLLDRKRSQKSRRRPTPPALISIGESQPTAPMPPQCPQTTPEPCRLCAHTDRRSRRLCARHGICAADRAVWANVESRRDCHRRRPC